MRESTTETTNDYRTVYVAGTGDDRYARSRVDGMIWVAALLYLAFCYLAYARFSAETTKMGVDESLRSMNIVASLFGPFSFLFALLSTRDGYRWR